MLYYPPAILLPIFVFLILHSRIIWKSYFRGCYSLFICIILICIFFNYFSLWFDFSVSLIKSGMPNDTLLVNSEMINPKLVSFLVRFIISIAVWYSSGSWPPEWW